MIHLKKHAVVLTILVCNFNSWTQVSKPIIDSDMLGTWPTLIGDIKLSGNGRYIAYTVGNQPIGKSTFVLQAINNNWKREQLIENRYQRLPFYFSADNRWLLRQSSDSLWLESTTDGQQKLLATLAGPLLTPGGNKGHWTAWHPKNRPQDLILYNLVSGHQQTFPQTISAAFDEKGTTLIVQQRNIKNILRWINLAKTITDKIIWEADTIAIAGSFHFDETAQQLCFLVHRAETSSIFYYHTDMLQAVEKYHTNSLPTGWQLTGLQGFNSTGHYLLANLTSLKEPHRTPNPSMVAVDVWSYQDEVIHPSQIAHGLAAFSYDKNGLLSIPAGKNLTPATLLNPEGLNTHPVHDYCILSNDTIVPPIGPDSHERWVLPTPRIWLQPLDGSERRELPLHQGFYNVSPGGRWLLFWSNKRGQRSNFYSYEIATGKTFNLTEALPVSVAQEKIPLIDSTAVGIAAWFQNDETVLLYDNYDIWQVDLAAKKTPVNVTAGYGLRTNIKLRLAAGAPYGIEPAIINGNEKLLLTGYNEQTKYNGFLELKLSATRQDPQLLSMHPFSWLKTNSQVGTSAIPANPGITPLKGGNGNKQLWVIMGESATEYPNYYFTQDFKRFTPLTRFEPQKNYNWLTTEMVNWSLPDGQTGQGILYKPENFDSTKKYPVLFNYYERKSGWMYQFSSPGFSLGKMNIPWFVSRGYLVFTPDIPFSNGSQTGISSGEHAWLALESAAAYLSKRSYIDSSRLGLQSYSFGGQLTLCIYTRSKRFAAAMEGAGFSDDMSTYLGIINAGGNWSQETSPVQGTRENGHNVLGANPWEKPALYLKNSSVWRADQIGSPLLILHNKKDDQVPWQQGVEMYMALRRLGKPCWMLQYDGEAHGVHGKAAKDYTIRMTQYFDHYLKGKPAPRWMTQGIPARFKQVENRYELDPAGWCNKECLICANKTSRF